MSEVLNYKAMSAGKKYIICKINSKEGVTEYLDVKQAVINDVMFTDSNGLKIEKAGWGQKINIWIDQKELVGEKIEIVVWDDDTGSADDPVKTIPIESYNGNLIAFHLDSEVKEKTGNVGAFYVKVNAPDLIATNETAEFPKVSK